MNLIYIYTPWGARYIYVRMSGNTTFLFHETSTFGLSLKSKNCDGESKDPKPYIK